MHLIATACGFAERDHVASPMLTTTGRIGVRDRTYAMEADRLSYYEASFVDLRECLIRVLGAPTVNRLVDRAVAEVAPSHPGIATLRCHDGEVMFAEVRTALAEATDDQIRDSFTAFNGVLLVVVARLLGKEIADRLTNGLSVAEYLRRGGLNGK